jgi:hypothetical protein
MFVVLFMGDEKEVVLPTGFFFSVISYIQLCRDCGTSNLLLPPNTPAAAMSGTKGELEVQKDRKSWVYAPVFASTSVADTLFILSGCLF